MLMCKENNFISTSVLLRMVECEWKNRQTCKQNVLFMLIVFYCSQQAELLKQLQREIEALKEQLRRQQNGTQVRQGRRKRKERWGGELGRGTWEREEKRLRETAMGEMGGPVHFFTMCSVFLSSHSSMTLRRL